MDFARLVPEIINEDSTLKVAANDNAIVACSFAIVVALNTSL
jgi:hypothetical protein